MGKHFFIDKGYEGESFRQLYIKAITRVFQVCFVLSVFKIFANYYLEATTIATNQFWIAAMPTFILFTALMVIHFKKFRYATNIVMYLLPISFLGIAISYQDASILLLVNLFPIGSFIVFAKQREIVIYNFYIAAVFFVLFFTAQSLFGTATNAISQISNIIIFGVVQFSVLYIARSFFLFLFKKLKKENIALSLNNEKLKTMQNELITKNNKLQEQNKVFENEGLHNSPARFISIISHDVKAPLLAVKNIFDFTKNESSNTQINTLLPEIHSTINNTVTLLDNLLDWAKHSFLHTNNEHKVVNIDEILPKVVGLYNLAITNKRINLVIENNANAWVEVNEEIFKTMLRNLINNAVKFSPENGNIIIAVTKKGNEVVIELMNNAYNVCNEQIEYLNQNENIPVKNLQKTAGSGVGLLVVKDFVKKCNASLQYTIVNNEYIKCSLTFASSNVRVLTNKCHVTNAALVAGLQ